jgi:cellulose synthase/poly-beta-1,6-N-acetylglucosamine synthase-like glycosyltransferase
MMHQKLIEETVVVTLGLCVKDSERTIKEAILSILCQTFDKKRMEVIVVDDGCKDKTIPIIRELFSKEVLNLRVYTLNAGGLTKARQMVIDEARGYLVLYIDGDMVFPKNFVDKLFELMEKNSSLGAAQGTMKGILNRNPIAELEDLSYSSAYEIGIHRSWRRNPQTLGTGGTIFRIVAVRAAGGFDTQIKGAAEDADLSARIKSAGYSLSVSEVEFQHEFKKTLSALWKQYVWYGYGMHYFYHKHGRLKKSMLVYFWPIAYIWGLIRSILVFKATRKKFAFFLPSYNFFRATAWWFGFIKAHLEGYGHKYRSETKKTSKLIFK